MSTHTYTKTHSTDDTTENGVVADAIIAGLGKVSIDTSGDPFALLVPRGAELTVINPEVLRYSPVRPRGDFKPLTVEGLIAYCKEHDAGATEVWITPERITAVLNAKDEETGFGWGDHRATLTLQHSPEWQHWARFDGTMLDQAAFAEHVEEGMADIVKPDSAEMLEVAQHIHVARSAAFRSSQHLHSGRVAFVYDETDVAAAGAGKTFEIPEEFELGIPVFVGEDAYKVKARFRYRLKEGALTLGYKLDRPDLVKLDAAGRIAQRLRGLDEDGKPVEGQPAMPFVAVFDGTPGDPPEVKLLHH